MLHAISVLPVSGNPHYPPCLCVNLLFALFCLSLPFKSFSLTFFVAGFRKSFDTQSFLSIQTYQVKLQNQTVTIERAHELREP